MKPELKNKWCEALRSGNYSQGQKVLCGLFNQDNYYCCLGVLKEVAKEVLEVDPIIIDSDDGLELSKEQLNEFGLTLSMQNMLIDMNDRQKLSFTAIADYIEKKVQ